MGVYLTLFFRGVMDVGCKKNQKKKCSFRPRIVEAFIEIIMSNPSSSINFPGDIFISLFLVFIQYRTID